MSCRVQHLNKTTGVSYVYESVSYWDKEKRQARSKQICIGKLDPDTGDLIPSRRLQAVAPVSSAATAAQEAGPSVATAAIVGPSLILDALSNRLGLAKIIKSVFPEFHGQILTMAYYLAAHGSPLSQCASWTRTHGHPRALLLRASASARFLGRSAQGETDLHVGIDGQDPRG